MTQSAIPDKNQKIRTLFLAFFTGIIGAFCLIFMFLFTLAIWIPLVTYNWILLLIQLPQMLLAGLFILLLTGAGAIKYSLSEIHLISDAIKQGTIAGAVMGIVIALYITNAGILSDNLSLPIIIRWFMLMIVICTSGTVAGAYLFCRSQLAKRKIAAEEWGRKQIPFTLRLLVFCIILTMVLPPVLAFAGTRSGIIANDCSECRIHQDVQAERVSNQSIQITYTSKVPSIPWIGPYEPFDITINGKDVSNQFVIQQQGITCRIEPSEGLSYNTESTVVLSGEAVSTDNNRLTHVRVVSRNGSPSGITLYDNSI